MHRVRTYNAIAVKGLDRFSRENYEVASELSNPDAFLIRSQKLHDMEFPESLKAIGRAGAGVNNVGRVHARLIGWRRVQNSRHACITRVRVIVQQRRNRAVLRVVRTHDDSARLCRGELFLISRVGKKGQRPVGRIGQ